MGTSISRMALKALRAQNTCAAQSEALNAELGESCARLRQVMIEEGATRDIDHSKTFEWPEIMPSIEIKWADLDHDCMEGDDYERICIRVSNCFANVEFCDFEIRYIVVTDAAGNLPATLPDGAPSSCVYPLGPICFGTIPPSKDGVPGSVSREAVIINRGAKPGDYGLELGGLCFSVKKQYHLERRVHKFSILQD